MQKVWRDIAEKEPDLKHPIPESWNLKTPRCGLRDTAKCGSYKPECSKICQK